MNPNLSLSKKTYYALGLVATGLAMAQAIAALMGRSLALLDNLSFIFTGLMFLFLASVKGTPKGDKGVLFGCFLLLIGSAFLPIPLLSYALMGLLWPCFALFIKKRDSRFTPQLRAICIFEALWFVARVLVGLGQVSSLAIPANLLGLVCAVLHGWLMLSLYQRERDEA